MPETLYAALNRLGASLSQPDQDACAVLAALLRVRHAAMKDADSDDVLLELADQLDTLAMPIGVKRS